MFILVIYLHEFKKIYYEKISSYFKKDGHYTDEIEKNPFLIIPSDKPAALLQDS